MGQLHTAGLGWALGTPREPDPEIPSYVGSGSQDRQSGAPREWRGRVGEQLQGRGVTQAAERKHIVLLPAWWVRPCRGSLLGPSPAALKAEMLTRYGVWLVRFFSFAVVSGRNSTRIFSVPFWLSASQ